MIIQTKINFYYLNKLIFLFLFIESLELYCSPYFNSLVKNETELVLLNSSGHPDRFKSCFHPPHDTELSELVKLFFIYFTDDRFDIVFNI